MRMRFAAVHCEVAQLPMHQGMLCCIRSWHRARMDSLRKERVRLFPKIGAFAVLLLLSLALSATTLAAERPHIRHYKSFKGPDRTITWRAWREVPGDVFRCRTGDRYLGGEQWEHYLCFEQHPGQAKAIKLFMIHLASESVEDVVLRPGLRYAILKVTNYMMTAHKGEWMWTAREDEGTQGKTRLRGRTSSADAALQMAGVAVYERPTDRRAGTCPSRPKA